HALHAVCDCYVSSHCAEAWGLSISDAMSFGNLVVATGYSGNMEYMRDDNSFPVRYDLTNIKKEDLRFQPVLLHPEMSWAYIDTNDLIHKMMLCLGSSEHSELRENAKKIAVHYSHRSIANVIAKRLISRLRGSTPCSKVRIPPFDKTRK
ncbi:MAG: glycosyltransferase, partial [Candidatus Desulfacyla sp.]